MTENEPRSPRVVGLPGLESIWRDARYAVRRLSRNAGFTLTVILTLALCIGANTAIFSVVNALLLEELPYADPGRVGTIYARTAGAQSFDARRNIDGEQWEMLRDNVPSLLSAVSGTRATGTNFQSGSGAQYVLEGRVSSRYFDVLALRHTVGRSFSEDEDRPNGAKAVVLSHALWRAAFASDPNVLGRAVLLKGESYTVIGVLPEEATTPLRADVYTPLRPSREGEGQAGNFAAIVRLRDDRTWQQADDEINRAWAETARDRRFAEANPGTQISYYSVPLREAQTNALRPQVVGLMLAATFILLIACANLAGLTLVRLLRRTRELCMQVALGASAWRIQRQLWIENLLLAVGGGIAGLGAGSVALRGLLELLPRNFLPVGAVPLDGRVLAFTLIVSLLTCFLFGALPALAIRKADLRSAMGSRGTTQGAGVRVRKGLIAGEVALTVVLLVGAGLLIRTLIHFENMPPGFDSTGVSTAKVPLNDARYREPAAFRALLDRSLAAMREIPGVQSAAVGLSVPYERPLIDGVIPADGDRAGQPISTNEVYVTPGYFSTLDIPVLTGRSFDDSDGPDAQRVVIVNQAFARKFLGDVNPIGRYLNGVVPGDGPNSAPDEMRIVGVVGDTVLSAAARLNPGTTPLTSEETIYRPYAQIVDSGLLSRIHTFFEPSWIVRIGARSTGLTARMQDALSSADRNLTFSGFYAMSDHLAATLALQRIQVTLLTAMAGLALILSAVGIFALVSSVVAQRAREIGIRIALGSTIRRTMLHVGRSGAGAAVLGTLLGLLLCVGALRVMRSVVYGIGVYDLPTIATVVLILLFVTLFATIVPTMRISRIDPAKTLRAE